jgi:F0F1-type ATP synthase assembly protein I
LYVPRATWARHLEKTRTLATPPPRDPLSAGMMWASRITSVALAFVLPALGGALLDRWLGTSPVGVLVGAVLGFAVGMLQLLRIARTGSPN